MFLMNNRTIISILLLSTLSFANVGSLFSQTREFRKFLNQFEKVKIPFETDSIGEGPRYETEKNHQGWLKTIESLEVLSDEAVWKYIIKDSSELGKDQKMWEWLIDEQGNRTWDSLFRYVKTAYIPKVKFKPVKGLFPVIYYEKQWWTDTSRLFLAIFNSEGKMLTKKVIYDFENHINATIFGDMSFERRTKRYINRSTSKYWNDWYCETTTELFVFCHESNQYLKSKQLIEEVFDGADSISYDLDPPE